MMTSQISTFVNFTKTQKSKYLQKETFFLQIKIFITHQGLHYGEKYFCSEGNLYIRLIVEAKFGNDSLKLSPFLLVNLTPMHYLTH